MLMVIFFTIVVALSAATVCIGIADPSFITLPVICCWVVIGFVILKVIYKACLPKTKIGKKT